MHGFSVTGFLQLLAGRRLVLWGCSVTRQMFEYLAARLRHHALPGNPVIPYGMRSYPVRGCKQLSAEQAVNRTLGPDRLTLPCFRKPYRKLEDECLKFSVPGVGSNNTAALCYVYARREVMDKNNLGMYHALAPQDIVLANVGVHFNVPLQMKKALAKWRDILATSRQGPLLVWRENTAQHFGVMPGGNYPHMGYKGFMGFRARKRLKRVDPETFRCTVRPAQLHLWPLTQASSFVCRCAVSVISSLCV
jgi:hypothetical protein